MTIPHAPALFARPEASAIRAVAAGVADERQQKLAMAAIGEKACLAGRVLYVAGGPEADRAQNFGLGRQFVAAEIARAIKTPLDQFPEVDHSNG